MIDADKTLYISTIKAINKLRYQAKNDPKIFKSIIQGILINDILEWAQEKESQIVHDHLQELRNSLFMCNSAFDIQYSNESNAYVNVNTPQTNSTWQQVWDSENAVILKSFGEKKGEKTYIPVSSITIKNLI